MTKKLIAMLLALVLLVTCLPMSVLAADVEEIEDPSTEVYSEAPAEAAAAPEAEDIEDAAAAETTAEPATSGTTGELTWNLDAKGTLTISGTGYMGSYDEDPTESPWYPVRESIKKVVISKGALSIGCGAFAWCVNMTSVSIPKTVTAIGDSAFYYCSSLKSVTIPSGVSVIDGGTFAYCSSLTSVSLPKTVSLIEESAFAYCLSLKSITLPAAVTTIGKDAFYYCGRLKSITIPKNVVYIGLGAFNACESLKTVTFKSRQTYVDGYAFWGTPWTASHEDKYGNLVINGVLVQCSDEEITSAVVPFGVSAIATDAFWGCYQMTELVITSDVCYIGDNAFEDCNALETVHYTGTLEEWNAIDGRDEVVTNMNTLIYANYVYGEWKSSGKKWYYYENNVPVTSDWRDIDDDDDGICDRFWFDAKGVMATGWKTIDGYKYYFDKDGHMQTGRTTIGKKTYYFCDSDVTFASNGAYEPGAMITGLCDINTRIYDDNGEFTGVTRSYTYYFNPKTGVMVTGFQAIDGKKYYFEPYSGAMVKDTLYAIGTKTYTFYDFDSNGVMQTDWQTIDGNVYYFNLKTGAAYTGLKKIDGLSYYFGIDGIRQYGKIKIGSKYYYFAVESDTSVKDCVVGQMMKDYWKYIDGHFYYFNSSGVMVTKKTKIHGVTWDFNSDGTLVE